MTDPGVLNHVYRFSDTQNDGRITQRKDWISGEEVSYQYESLNRLISASTTGPQWGQSFRYDGFGNMLAQTVTKGTAPTLSVLVDPASNRITTGGYSYDSNGNLTAMPLLTMSYNVDNRLAQATSSLNGTDQFVYDPQGQRVWKSENGPWKVYFYGVDGNLLGRYGGPSSSEYNIYFGRKLIYTQVGPDGPVVEDRLASTVKHFPYGEEPTTTQQNRTKFATYFRDTTTALDYARNRYYARTIGRFTTTDPYGGSAQVGNPQSWNRFSYVENDPVNHNDPSGLMYNVLTNGTCSFWGDCISTQGGGPIWDDFGGHYHSFDLRDEMTLDSRAYMAAHITPSALAGLASYDAFVAASAAKQQVPTAIRATADCTTTRWNLINTVVERDITYQLYVGSERIKGGAIQETITAVWGQAPGVTGGNKNPFEDTIAVAPDLKPYKVQQKLTATFGGRFYPNLPLYPSPTAQQTVPNNTNIIEAYPDKVTVNGNPGAKPGDCSFP